ncbi:tyrosine-type recombinase/integrase [Microbacterium sp. ZXX196]|uniref:tyrosine-type recombinase/integrase n=1 Tax=Microbacterium sp. ZXX196 TaxID=2609291 RepID=UPI0012B95C32|nr:tyrosine-type recombinase/integrase [Microbacterium sp. ZXX196]MTE24625.1 tyrosine-type recombinase/integrase [Microbacterium sp. ZXX196]
MARPKRALGELGKVTYSVEPNGLVVARARVFDGGGKERRPNGSGATAAEALAALQEAADLIGGRVLAKRTELVTIAQLAEAWLKVAYHDDDPRVLHQRREQTVDGYASVIRAHILPRAGAIAITDMTADRADGLLMDVAREKTVMTANKVRNVLSLMYDWAIQQGVFSAAGSIQQTRHGAVVVANPIRATRRADEPSTVYFELDAVQVKYILHLIREVWPERHRARFPVGRRPNFKLLADYILITLGTSERTAEPIAIRFQDVRFEAVEQPDGSLTMDTLVWVGGTMVRTRSRGLFRQDSPKAERQKRWVRAPQFAAKVLSELVANHVPNPELNPDDVLFTSERGRPRDPSAVSQLMRMFRREFEPELLAIGVDADHLTFRSLRKAVAAAVSGAAGVEVARDLLGHSDESITEGHYAKRPELIVVGAADALDKVFAGIDA